MYEFENYFQSKVRRPIQQRKWPEELNDRDNQEHRIKQIETAQSHRLYDLQISLYRGAEPKVSRGRRLDSNPLDYKVWGGVKPCNAHSL